MVTLPTNQEPNASSGFIAAPEAAVFDVDNLAAKWSAEDDIGEVHDQILEELYEIALSHDATHAANVAGELAARQAEIERIIADLPAGADVDALKQQSAQLGGMIAQINSNIAVGNMGGAMMIAAQAYNVIGVSRTEEKESYSEKDEKKQRQHNYMQSVAIYSGGMLGATTVLSFDELIDYSHKKVENIQTDKDKEYEGLDQGTKDTIVTDGTANIKDVYEKASKDIADLKEKINAMDVPQEEKDKLLATLDKLEKAGRAEAEHSAQTHVFEDEIAGTQKAWDSLSPEEKKFISGDSGTMPEWVEKNIDVGNGKTVKAVVFIDSKGQTIDGKFVEDIKEKYGVDNIKDIDTSKMTDAERQDVASAKFFESRVDNIKELSKQRAEEAQLDNENTLNKLREQADKLERDPRYKVKTEEIERSSNLLKNHAHSEENIQENKKLAEELTLKEQVDEHRVTLVNHGVLQAKEAPDVVSDTTMVASIKEAMSGLSNNISFSGNDNVIAAPPQTFAENYHQDRVAVLFLNA